MSHKNENIQFVEKLQQEADQYLRNKNYVAAELGYQKIIQQDKTHIGAHLQLSLLYKQFKKYDAAMTYASQALTIEKNCAEAIDILAELLCYKGEFAKGETLFRKAIDVNASFATSYQKLGMLLHSQKRIMEALECFQKAVEIEPKNSEVWFFLGSTQMQLNQMELAFASLGKSLDIGGYPVKAIYDFAEAALSLLQYDALQKRLSMILDSGLVQRDKQHGLYIYLAKVAFLENRWDDARSLLKNALYDNQSDVNFPNFVGLLTYYNFLNRLLKLQEVYTSCYNGKTDYRLYAIGESNCLSAAYTHITINGKSHEVVPKLIVGAQARHFGQLDANKYQDTFKKIIASLPKDAAIILIFGEIDCRINFGILPYHKKTQQPINTIVENIVKSYVAFVAGVCKDRALNITIQLVQAPNPNLELYDKSDVVQVKEIVKYFNKLLASEAKKNGWRVLDIYRASLDKFGESDPSKYIDEYHLKPNILGLAFQNHVY